MKTLILSLMLLNVFLPAARGEGEEPRAGNPFYPVWTARECLYWRDSLVLPEGAGRTGWARRCAPEYEGYYRYGEKHGSADGMRTPLYPVFGTHGERGEPMNPRRYFPPVAPPDHDEECDLPMDYTLVGTVPGTAR